MSISKPYGIGAVTKYIKGLSFNYKLEGTATQTTYTLNSAYFRKFSDITTGKPTKMSVTIKDKEYACKENGYVADVPIKITGMIPGTSLPVTFNIQYEDGELLTMSTNFTTLGYSPSLIDYKVTPTTLRTSVKENLFTGLIPGTEYAYRAFAETASGVVYGEECAFKTNGERPTDTAIEEVVIENNEPKTFNVYSVSGAMVRHQATSLEGLPRGIYVVNKRKVFVK